MNTLIAPASQGRADYMRVVEKLAAAFNTGVDNFIATYKVYDDLLKMPTLLVPNTSAYTMNPVKAVETPVPGENKIDRNDFFAVTGVGIRFTRATYTSSSGAYSAFGNYEEYTYPYIAAFSGANEASALQTIVRGQIGLSVNNDQQWSLPCSELVYKDEYINAQTPTIVYGGNDGKRGIKELNSIVILDGNADNLLTLSLLTGVTTNIDGSVTNGTTRNYVMPVLLGIRIKNMAGGGYALASCRV